MGFIRCRADSTLSRLAFVVCVCVPMPDAGKLAGTTK